MLQPTDLDDLCAQWEAVRQADGRMAVQPGLIPDGDVRTFLGPMAQPLLLGGTVLSLVDATRLEITGALVGTWAVPSVAGGLLAGVALKIVFLKPMPSAPISSTLLVTGATLAFAGRPLPVAGQLLTGTGLLSLKMVAQSGNPVVLSLTELISCLAGPTDFPAVPSDMPLFKTVKLSDVALCFGLATESRTYLTASVGVDGDWPLAPDGKITLQEIGVTASVQFEPTADGRALMSLGADVHAKARLASAEVDVVMPLLGRDSCRIDVFASAGSTLPGLSDLAAFVGGNDLRNSVESGFKALDLGDLGIDRLTIVVDAANKRLQHLALRGHVMIAGGRVDLNACLPDFTIGGGLPQMVPSPQPIALSALAEHCLGDAADLPKLDITELLLFAYPSQRSYRIAVETSEDWIWQPNGSGPALALQNVGFNVSKDPTGVTVGLDASFEIGSFTVGLSGQHLGKGAGWQLMGSGGQTQAVGLGDLVKELAQKLGAPVPTDLINAIGTIQVNALDVAVSTKDKSFQLLADVTTKGRVPLGDRSFDVELKAFVSSTVDASGKRSLAGHLEGDLTIGKAAFVVSFDFGPAAKVFKANWRSLDGSTLSFTDIAEALHIPRGADVPKELDLGLKAASFEYQSAASTFVLSAESTSFGDAFFTAGKDQNGRMGFVFGVDLPANLKLSSLPGIGERLKPADFLTFKQGAIVISTGDFPAYQLPTLPALPPAASATATPWTARFASGRAIKPVATGATLQLTTSGLSLAAIVDFAATSDVRAKNLRGIARADEMMLQASIGGSGLRLMGALVGAAAVSGGTSNVSLSQPRVEIDCGPEVTFQISGGVNFTIGRPPNGTPVTATARLVINETEAQVAVEISGQQKPLPPPPGIKGLHIESFGVVMGVYFAPPGLDLGLTGNFTIGSVQNLKGDSFGIVLEVLEEAANVLYLAFYVDQLDLGEVLTLFTDQNDPALVRSLEFIKASDLGFHWCDSIVTLPDGSIVPPGFGFSASLDVLGFGAHADLEVGIADGIHGQAQIAPFSLKGVPVVADNGAFKALGQFDIDRPHAGITPSNPPDVLTVTGDGKGITRTYQEINGTWQQVDNASVKRTLPAPPTRTETIVAAGGPVLAFNCKQAPFIQGSLTVALFEAHAAVSAHVDQTGFGFGLDFDVGNIEKFTLNCTLQDKEHFAASSAVGIKIDASVGPIHVAGHDCGRLHLATRVDGSLAVTLDPSQFSLTLDGTFNFQGLTFAIPHLSLDVAPAKLAQLPPTLIEMISGQADQIFHRLYDDGAHWAGLVKSGVITGAGDVATTLKDAYHMTSDQAEQAMRTAGYDADTAAKAVKGAFGTVVSGLDSAGHTIGQDVSDTGQDIKHEGEQVGHDIGDGLKHAFHL